MPRARDDRKRNARLAWTLEHNPAYRNGAYPEGDPITDEDAAAIAEGMADLAAGRTYSVDEAREILDAAS